MQIHFSTHTCQCDVTLGFQWVLHSVWSIQNPVSHVGRRDGLLLGRWKKKKKYPQTRRFCHSLSPPIGFSGGSGSKESAPCRRPRFNPWVGKIPWRWKWQPTPVFLPGEFHGQTSLAGHSSWDCKESDTGLTNTFPCLELWETGKKKKKGEVIMDMWRWTEGVSHSVVSDSLGPHGL